jgi:hypothetical protein
MTRQNAQVTTEGDVRLKYLFNSHLWDGFTAAGYGRPYLTKILQNQSQKTTFPSGNADFRAPAVSA